VPLLGAGLGGGGGVREAVLRVRRQEGALGQGSVVDGVHGAGCTSVGAGPVPGGAPEAGGQKAG